jgi:hypothetical protein
MSIHRFALIALALLAGTQAVAAVYKVGPATDSQCTHTTLAAAITSAVANPGADTIRITNSQPYLNQALTISSNDDLEIIGGFLGCSRATPEPGVKIVIDGANASVLRILGNGRVTMRNLEISGGNAVGGSEGGGIYFQGNGTLDIADSAIINNIAGYGGGIYARGTAVAAELLIGANVTIASNTARYSGGGVYIDQLEMAMREPNSAIAFNTAQGMGDGGYGGGLTIRAAGLSAYAYVGTSGIADLGAIFGNEARYGGGVAVVGGDSLEYTESQLQMFTTDIEQPGSIRDNFASVAGGGVFIAGYSDLAGSVDASANFSNARLDDNRAPRGAAAFADSLGSIDFNYYGSFPSGAVSCQPGALCGGIVGNETENANGDPVDGAVIEVASGGFTANVFYFGPPVFSAPRGGIEIRGNRGGQLIGGTGDGQVLIHNVLVTDNTVTADLLSTSNDGSITIRDSTIAGNTITAPHIIWGSDIAVHGTILWQPGKTSLAGPRTTLDISDTLADETISLGGPPAAYYAPPRFRDPARGDYGLRAASPAVDFRAPRSEEQAEDLDVFANRRNRDLLFIPDASGTIDLGAIELTTSFPLVLNGDFDADRNLWSAGTTGTSNWTSADNISGPSGSGSIRVAATGTNLSAIGSAQCIHLPAASRYLLSGFGRNATATNSVGLRWEFRRNGGEQCTAGEPDRTGDLLLSGSTLWTRPEPASIPVTEAEFTPNSSITITLVASGRAPDGWFDGIYLLTGSLDAIFANGFD